MKTEALLDFSATLHDGPLNLKTKYVIRSLLCDSKPVVSGFSGPPPLKRQDH